MKNTSTDIKKLKQKRTVSTRSVQPVPHEKRHPPTEFAYESAVWDRIERMCPMNGASQNHIIISGICRVELFKFNAAFLFEDGLFRTSQ
jgi:hypothetical protein